MENGQKPTKTIVFPRDIPSSVSEAECAQLAMEADGKVVLELGAWRGRTTVVLAQTAAQLHSVDWHQGDPHAGEGVTIGPYFSNLIRYGVLERTVAYVGRFSDVLPVLRTRTFDMIFHDGYHSYRAVHDDIETILARRLLRRDGIICFHDYGVETAGEGEPFGVTKAVDEFFQVDETVESLAVVRSLPE
jgi:methyltransferase family protein